jgi:hypothetical protein
MPPLFPHTFAFPARIQEGIEGQSEDASHICGLFGPSFEWQIAHEFCDVLASVQVASDSPKPLSGDGRQSFIFG